MRASRNASREVKKAKFNFEKKMAEHINKGSKSYFMGLRHALLTLQ